MTDRVSARVFAKRPFRMFAAAVCAVAMTSGCAIVQYERGLVRRIDSRKTVKLGGMQAVATKMEDGRVAVTVRRTSHVKIKRRKIYQTIEGEGTWKPWMEPLELLTSPLYLPIMLVMSFVVIKDDNIKKWGPWTRLKIATAPINPFCSYMGLNIHRSNISDKELFRGPRRILRFAMRMPLSEQPVKWGLLRADGVNTGAGDARTDVFGRLFIDGDATQATHVQVQGDGWSTKAPIAAAP